MGLGIGKFECIDCPSSDGMEVYEEDDGTYNATCFAGCAGEKIAFKSHNKLCESYLKDELGITPIKNNWKKKGSTDKSNKGTETNSSRSGGGGMEGVVGKRKKKEKKPITLDERKRLFKNTTEKGKGFRGISDKVSKESFIRYEIGEETGEVESCYYPVFKGKKEDGKLNLVGYKKRVVEGKKFFAVGENSKECDFFNMHNCSGSGKYLIISGGEHDALASEEMIKKYMRGKSNHAPIDTISGTVGETSMAEQCAYHYDWLSGYDSLIVDMDDDEAGRSAEEKLLTVLPQGKVKVMRYSEKDANKMLDEGKEGEYIKAIYNAQRPKLAGVVSGSDMHSALIQAVSADLIPLPPELKPLEDKLCGGLPIGEIVNILAASGIGKSSLTNLLILYWIFNSPYKVGILSLEAGAGKFLMRIVSSYLGNSIMRMKSKDEKLAFINSKERECLNLYIDENGDDRFTLVDDHGDIDTLENIKAVIEKMIRQAGCKLIIIDPIQDCLDSLTTEEQAAFVGWQKKIKARDMVTFININHTRKSGGGKKAGSQGGELTEEDMQGTSALYKSAAVNIILTRNKEADDQQEQNTTSVRLSKSRDGGETGKAGFLYYDLDSARLHNKDEYFKNKTEVEGY